MEDPKMNREMQVQDTVAKAFCACCVDGLGGRKKEYKQNIWWGGCGRSTGEGRWLVALQYWQWTWHAVGKMKTYFIDSIGNVHRLILGGEEQKEERAQEWFLGVWLCERNVLWFNDWEIRKACNKIPFWPCQVWGISKMAKVDPSWLMALGGGHGYYGLNVKGHTVQDN